MIKIWLKIERSVINVLIILEIKIKNQLLNTKHVYENNTERTILIGRSGCGKTFLMLSLRKDKNPEDVYKFCKTGNQYPSKYLNQSSGMLTLEDYGNKTIVFHDKLGSKEARDIETFLTRGRHQNFDTCYISQSWYELSKNTIRNICSRFMLFPQTLKDITVIYNDVSGLHMSFSKWRVFCRGAWKKRYN